MRKYQVLMTGILSLMLVFGFTLTACKNDSGDDGGGVFGNAIKGRGDGDESSAPAAPSSIYAVASSSSITVSWALVSGASGYKVYRADNSSGPYVSWEIGQTSYTDKDLSQGLYYYKVKAYNSKGDSPDSRIVSAAITGSSGSTSIPATPTGVTATRISADQVYVTWTPVSGVTTYLVYWAEEAAGLYKLDGTTNTPSHTSKDWNGYDHGYFKVSAVNAAGEGPKSAEVRFGAYGSGGSSGSAPSAPSGVSASATSASTITVYWDPVSGATGYYVYRAIDDPKNENFSYWADARSSTSYSDTELFQGTWYYYKIVAYNSYGESPRSTSYGQAKTTETIPSAPSGVFASATSSSSITVSWSEVPGATSYKVYHSNADSSYSFLETVPVSSTASTSYTHTGLSSGSTHYYKVSAVNSAGESPQSISRSATTWSSSSVSRPNAPTGVWAYQLSSSEVYVSWNAVSGATEYNVYWASYESGPWYFDGTVTSPPFTSPDWSSMSNAYFKVTAVNAAGYESNDSSVAHVSLSGSSSSTGTVPEAQKKR